MAVHCTRCTGVLAQHCEANDCGWLTCGNKACEAKVFDTIGGRLELRDGTVLGWQEWGGA